ncbi:hypothetical protein PVAP13_2KG357600 [Panicum virgatum]|uniref:Uncharacterized protein n=1 Tax=Panicum virgatum TaxID=38727 RepID=A0A8T0WB27_PANVG|nr:hypothetical protein PVAP13_2KG357600 [Panicum virgatum]
MGLQHHDPSAELCLVVGLHSPQDVPTLACLMEVLRCSVELAAYAVGMVQLTDQTATDQTARSWWRCCAACSRSTGSSWWGADLVFFFF